MKFKFDHYNFNVKNLEKSIEFYKEALGFEVDRIKESENFTLAFLKDEFDSPFRLELTFLNDHQQSYDLGECEFHLALRVKEYDQAYALHKKMGCICYENTSMGIYFIEDPDGYWIEIVPIR